MAHKGRIDIPIQILIEGFASGSKASLDQVSAQINQAIAPLLKGLDINISPAITSMEQLVQFLNGINATITQTGNNLTIMAQSANGIQGIVHLLQQEGKITEQGLSFTARKLTLTQELRQTYANLIASQKEVNNLELKGQTSGAAYEQAISSVNAYSIQLEQLIGKIQQRHHVQTQVDSQLGRTMILGDGASAQIQRQAEHTLELVNAKHQEAMQNKEEMSSLKLLEASRKQDETNVREYVSALQQLNVQEEQYQRLRLSGATEGEISAQERLLGYTREYVNSLLQKVQGTEAYKNAETQIILLLEQHASKMAQLEAHNAYQKESASANEYLSVMNQVLSAEVRLASMKQGGSTPQAIAAQQQYINLLREKAAALKSNITDAELLAKVEQELAIAQAKANAQMQQGSVAIKKQQSLFGSLVASMKMVIKTALLYSVAYGAIYKLVEAFRATIDTVKELDKAVVDLRIVTGGTQEEAEKLLSTYNKMAQELGSTTTEVSKAAVEWQRQGYSLAETNKLIENSMILSKVGMIESAEAQKYLTSAMKGYNVAVEDSLGIVDKLTAIDLNAAVSAGDLAEAMSRTAASADLAGVEMDELLGYLAVVGEVTQKSMSSVGESFKTIFARFGNIKAGKFVDDETGEDLKTWVAVV